MSAQTAKIIDLDERRRAKQSERTSNGGEGPGYLVPPLFAMTWVPVWFVPVFFTGNYSKAG